MAWFRLRNNAAVPVNAALSWADFNEFYANDIAPLHTDTNGVAQGGYAEWDVGGAAWHSLTVAVSNGRNQFGSNTAEATSEWVIGGIGVIATAVGIALIPFTGGLSAAASAAGAAALATAIGGAVVTIADITFAGVQFALKPVTIGNLYAPDGYNFEISGGNITYEMQGDKVVVTGFTPITVSWHNNESGTHGAVNE